MNRNSTRIVAALAPLLMAASLPALAIIKWDSGNCTSSLQTSCTDTVGGAPTVTYSAISNTGATNIGGNPTLASAYVVAYGTHLGVTSEAGPNAAANSGIGGNAAGAQETQTSPQHALDNNGNFESLLLSFTSSVTLSLVELGWSNTDSDITVLAYNGSGSPALLGSSYPQLTGQGWQLIGNYFNVCGSPPTCDTTPHSVAVNGGTVPVSSSYWLIGAYNNANFGAPADAAHSGTATLTGTEHNDYVKLLSVSGTSQPNTPPTSKVPEPSSLWLAALGMLGMATLRRRRVVV